MGGNEALNLLLFDGEEESFFSFHRRQVTEGGTFMLCSALFRHVGDLISGLLHRGRLEEPAQIEAALRGFYREVNGYEEITDEPISLQALNFDLLGMIGGVEPGPDEGGMASFLFEALALYGLIVAWLEPREVAGGQLIAKRWLGDVSNHYFFINRCRQFYSIPTVIRGRWELIHNSPGLLPLCWAELLHALQYKCKAGVCPYCHKVFLFPGNNYQKVNCGDPACRRAHLIHRHGGSAWEKERKQHSGGKRGRPRKTGR